MTMEIKGEHIVSPATYPVSWHKGRLLKAQRRDEGVVDDVEMTKEP